MFFNYELFMWKSIKQIADTILLFKGRVNLLAINTPVYLPLSVFLLLQLIN